MPPAPGSTRTVDHGGLLVPNAVGLTYPRMAEPDQIDFATAANAQWGVIDKCGVTVSIFTVTVEPGIALVNGKLVPVAGGSVTLGGSGPQDRFDSIVVDDGGNVQVLIGDPAVDPVFRDVPATCTLLAVVFCPPGADSYAGLVIDKRRFVSKSLLTKIAVTDPLIYNANGDGTPSIYGAGTGLCHYSVLGDGYMEWEGDTCLYRSAPETLRVKNNLQAIGNVSAGNSISGKRVIAQQEVTGSNLILADTPPPSAQAPFGAIHQNSVNGDLSVNTAAGWKQLAVADGIMPVGAIIQSVEPPTVMNPKGWVLLDGTVVSESDPQYTRLFTLSAFNFDGPPGARTLTLPNAMGKMLRGGVSGVGNSGGNDKVTLTVNNMPRHNHNVRTASGGGSSASGRTSFSTPHTHTVNGGLHGHPVSDPGHNHNGGEYPAGAFVCLVWGGQNKIDALFNDRNHTYSVESVQWTRPNTTGISVGSTGSEHNHDVSSEGAHDHAFALDPIAAHTHPVGEDDAGLGQSFDIVPSYLTTYTYIRA